MPRLRQLRRARRQHNQHPRRLDPPRQISNQIRRRRIRPLHIVNRDDQRMTPRRFLDERADLALQALLRSGRRLGDETRARRSVARGRRDLHAPARRDGSRQARQAAEQLIVLQAVEHFEHRQIRLASSQPLGTAAASDADRRALPREPRKKRFDQRRLADARFARDDDDAAGAAADETEFMPQDVDLGVAADDRCGRLRWSDACDRHPHRRRRQRRVGRTSRTCRSLPPSLSSPRYRGEWISSLSTLPRPLPPEASWGEGTARSRRSRQSR